MARSEFDTLTPAELLIRLHKLEEAGAGYAGEASDLHDALRGRLSDASTADVVALTGTALKLEPGELEDAWAYWSCISALRNRPQDPSVFETCKTWIGGKDPAKRKAGADILSQLGHNGRYPHAIASEALLERLLDDSSIDVVRAALNALGNLEIGNIEKIAALAHHDEEIIRWGVVHALTGRDEPLSLTTLINLSRDTEAGVRDWATFGLGQQSDVDTPELRAALAERLSDTDADVRGEALVGLARRRDPRALPVIEAELARDDVRGLAVEAASLMPDARFLADLTSILDAIPDDVDVRRAIEACRTGIPRSRWDDS